MLGQPLRFLLTAGVDAVQDCLAKGLAIFIHWKAVAAQYTCADTCDFLRLDAMFPNQLLGNRTEVMPPYLFRIMLKVVGRRIFHDVFYCTGPDHLKRIVHQDALGFKASYIDPQVKLGQITSPPFILGSCGIPSRYS